MMADDAARERDRAQRVATFTTALENMKFSPRAARCRRPLPAADGSNT